MLIGPGTVRAEGYGRLVGAASAAPTPPPAVLISRRFDIPWEAGLFAAADQPVIVYGPADAVRAARRRRAGRGRAAGGVHAGRGARPTCARAASARC